MSHRQGSIARGIAGQKMADAVLGGVACLLLTFSIAATATSDEISRTREAQMIMRDMGLAPGPLDGALSPQQESFIVQVQGLSQIKPTGRVDEATLSLIKAASREYQIRVDVVAGLRAAKPLQDSAYEEYRKTGAWPRAGDPRLSAAKGLRQGSARILWNGSAFVVRYDGATVKPIAGRSVSISVSEGCAPESQGCKSLGSGKTFLWRCHSADIPPNLLPPACRT